MKQILEIYKAKDGVSAKELREVLKYGQDLIGDDYLKWMYEIKLLGDASFVAEMDGGVYLISYYLFNEDRQKAAAPLKSIPSIQKYMERIEPLFEGSVPVRLETANSFWASGSIKERIG